MKILLVFQIIGAICGHISFIWLIVKKIKKSVKIPSGIIKSRGTM